jgi:hypothetical protein
VARGTEPGVRLRSKCPPHQFRDRRLAQASRLEQHRVAGAEDVQQLIVTFLRPARDDHQHRERIEPPGKKIKKPQGRNIDPLRIIDQHHHRRRRDQVDQQPVQPVQQVIQRDTRLGIGSVEQLPHYGGRPSENSMACWTHAGQQRFEQLPDASEGEITFQLRAPH